MTKKLALGVMVALVAALFCICAAAADQPLSADDVTLLLLGGSPSPKIITLVEQRGIGFKMNPDLAKKFHDAGASDDLIDVLSKAGLKAKDAPGSSPAPAAVSAPSTSPQQSQSPYSPIPSSEPSKVDRKVAEVMGELDSQSAAYAPRFSIVSLTGKKIDSADYKGKVLIVNFWASWCPYCRKWLPSLVEFQRRYYDQGLRVVGIAVRDQKDAVQSYCRREKVDYPVAMANTEMQGLFGGISGLPTTVLIGRDGRVYREFSGAPADPSRFEESIKALLARPAGGAEGSQQIAAASTPTTAKAAASPATAPTTAGAPASATNPNSNPATVDQKVAETLSGLTAPAATTAKPPEKELTDPNAAQIQQIIQEFAAKEKVFKEARNNYTYHQINKVQELGADNQVEGVYEQEWDILFDDSGKRIERVTYAPADTLKRIMVTQEDLSSMRSIQPFVLTTDEVPEYEIKYLGHVRVDQITAYVFSIRPKEIEKGHQYFQGVVWVDDQDLQIVKSEGKPVPELKTKKGENLFPRFTTWREQIDGKYWFPTYTMADDTLYFSGGPVHIKEVLRYTDYKQFKSKVRIISATPTDQPTTPAPPHK